MKRSHEDRMKLIDRLERKYEEKVRLRRQEKQQDIKRMLRKMRGRRQVSEDIRLDYIDEMFQRGLTTV